MDELVQILTDFKEDKKDMANTYYEILSLMGENQESVSDTPDESCVSHDVSDSNASRSSEVEVNSVSVEGALEIITDDGRFCIRGELDCYCVKHGLERDTCGDSRIKSKSS